MSLLLPFISTFSVQYKSTLCSQKKSNYKDYGDVAVCTRFALKIGGPWPNIHHLCYEIGMTGPTSKSITDELRYTDSKGPLNNKKGRNCKLQDQ